MNKEPLLSPIAVANPGFSIPTHHLLLIAAAASSLYGAAKIHSVRQLSVKKRNSWPEFGSLPLHYSFFNR
ncbi:MAG: hypothetical protein HQL67_02445 [Magnetococcales bacterium]|nr:hypothetical protein [Magnetococcales bacterium]